MNYLSQQDPKEYKKKRVIVRLDLNVPILEGEIKGDFRLRKSLSTLEWLKSAGAQIIIISHIKNDEGSTLKPVHNWLKKTFDETLTFCEDVYDVKMIDAALEQGSTVLVENIRNWDGEKENHREFSEYLASLGEVFVQDAFAVSHREHASVVGIREFLPTVFGFQVEQEVLALSKVFTPEHPLVMIFGGIKFDTKLPLIKKYLGQADNIIIVAGMANDVYMDAYGYEIGRSVYAEEIDVSFLKEEENVSVPQEVIVENEMGESRSVNVKDVKKSDIIMDADPAGLEEFREMIKGAGTIVWNGPLGWYEKGYDAGTKKMVELIADSDAYSVVGGGDTVALIEKLGLQDRFDFLSTGGGAMLEYLELETLVGLT